MLLLEIRSLPPFTISARKTSSKVSSNVPFEWRVEESNTDGFVDVVKGSSVAIPSNDEGDGDEFAIDGEVGGGSTF